VFHTVAGTQQADRPSPLRYRKNAFFAEWSFATAKLQKKNASAFFFRYPPSENQVKRKR
jgi:hypothetical protein